jgi:carboxymethylenebutenolidase
MSEVTIPTPRGKLPGYLATPASPGPWPGVVVIFDIGGMSQDLRNQADWLAREGYLALLPDLYRARSWLGCIRSIMRDASARKRPVFDDLDAARTWLWSSTRALLSVDCVSRTARRRRIRVRAAMKRAS